MADWSEKESYTKDLEAKKGAFRITYTQIICKFNSTSKPLLMLTKDGFFTLIIFPPTTRQN